MMSEEIEEKKRAVAITQFILFMQQKDIWPCELRIGDEARPLTGQEVLELCYEFKKL